MALVGGLWIAHLKTFECVKDDLRYDQPSVLFVVGGNDIPGRLPGACRTEAFLIRLHIVLPELPLRDVRKAELPVLFRLVNTSQETLALLFLREVEVELHDAGSVDMEMFLQIHDRMIPIAPDRLFAVRRIRDAFAAKNLGMHSNDQHFLIIGSIEDADPPAFRQIAGGAPKKVVLQFGGTWMFETEDLAALRIDAGHHVPDGAIFSGRIHRLKDQQDGVAVGCVMKLLQRTQLRNVLFQKLLILVLRLIDRLHYRGPLPKIDIVTFLYAEVL